MSYLKTGFASFDYTVPGTIAETGEFNVSLSYNSGYTGTISGAVTGVNIINGGSGYYDPPSIRISGAHSEASVSFSVDSSGKVTGATLNDCGSGYTTENMRTYLYHNLLEIKVNDGGGGYFDQPNVTVSGQGGVGSVFSGREPTDDVYATINSNNGEINSIRLYDSFSPTGYMASPVVSLDKSISGVRVIKIGSGYNSSNTEKSGFYPSFLFTGGGQKIDTKASGEALYGWLITGLRVTAPGSGWTTGSPPIFFTGKYVTDNFRDMGLTRASGYMSSSGTLTGIDLINFGKPWFEKPTIYFKLPSNTGRLPLPNRRYQPSVTPMMTRCVTGFKMTAHGYGYTGQAALKQSIISGAGDFEVTMAGGAQVTGIMSNGLSVELLTGNIEKTFTGTWNMLTGDYSSDYRSSNLYNNFQYFNPTGVTVPSGLSVVPVAVTHNTLFDNLESVALLSFSGSGISPINIYITGKR